jgi:hypothetical protein
MAKRVKLLKLGVMLRAESDATAKRMAEQLCPPGTTQAERIAINAFLDKVARAVRWPGLP